MQADEKRSTSIAAPAESSNRSFDEHVREAHKTIRGEYQIAEYVARLEVEECTRILTSAPAGLRDECRVGEGEGRSFERMIRAWTGVVLSGAEGG